MTPKQSNEKIKQLLASTQIVPVITVDEISQAKPLAQALVKGGLTVLEVTLRTPCAIEAIQEMSQVAGATVGVGTLVSKTDVTNAKKAGAVFGVSPGNTPSLLKACEAEELPILAGVSTVSEIMQMLELGYDVMKFFPAALSGGVKALQAFGSILPQAQFCPTGGIGVQTAREYLDLPNVMCIGGSWIIPKEALASGDFELIEKLALEACGV